jgi:hypothetical protein
MCSVCMYIDKKYMSRLLKQQEYATLNDRKHQNLRPQFALEAPAPWS